MINIVQNLSFLIVLIFCIIAKLRDFKSDKKLVNNNIKIQKYSNIILLILVMISSLILSYKVGSIPRGLHVDEAGSMYDAICISKYGVDRYLCKLPVYFINFGGGQNALYTYLASIFFKIFGISITIFRLPSIVLSLISLICLYKMIDENNNKVQALITAFVLVICPWFILKSRWGLESYLMCSLVTISTYFFMKALNSNKSYMYVLSGILWGISFYTYAISYIIIPAIIGIVFIYMLKNRKIDIKNIIYFSIPLVILGIPLVLMLAYNSGILENVSIPIFTIPKLWFYRGGEVSLKYISENIKNILDILFIKDFLNYNSIEQFGTLYIFSIPLFLFGIIESSIVTVRNIKNKEISLDFVMVLTFIISLFTGLCIEELNINKINVIYIPMIYFIGRFVYCIVNNLKYYSIMIFLIYFINCGMFLNYYFTEFANSDLIYFENDIIYASKRAEELNKEKINVEDCLNQTYIYALVANPISPYDFYESIEKFYYGIIKYGKYNFELQNEIDENTVYIIKNDTDKINMLIENGFCVENYGELKLLWK